MILNHVNPHLIEVSEGAGEAIAKSAILSKKASRIMSADTILAMTKHKVDEWFNLSTVSKSYVCRHCKRPLTFSKGNGGTLILLHHVAGHEREGVLSPLVSGSDGSLPSVV